MWSRETLSVGRAHETRFESTPGLDTEISQAGSDGGGGDSCARRTAPDRVRARPSDYLGEGREGSHSCVLELPAVPGHQHDSAVAQGDQLAGIATGVCASEEAILGKAPVGARIFCGELRHDNGRDDSRVHR